MSSLLLVTATLLCGLTTGLVFAFAVIVMPGLRTLPDREFLGTFKVIDRVIQNNDPLFLLVWVGSVFFLIAAGAMNVTVLAGIPRLLLISAVVVYLLGVQLPTFVVNVPLNNRLQATDLATLDAAALQRERVIFETRWTNWNAVRTFMGIVATTLLIAVVHAS